MLLTSLRRFLALELTLAEWLGTALMLAVPYVVLGMAWTAINGETLHGATGIGLIGKLIGSVLAWPALMVTGGCTA